MKKLLFLAIILFASQFITAQTGPLSQAEYVKMLYAVEKSPASKDDVISALRKRGISFVLTDGIRSLTRTKGRNDDELKRALEEADRRRQDPVAYEMPSAKEAAEVLEKARKATQLALDAMPDFVVKQIIARSAAYAGTGNWQPLDNVIIAVSYSTDGNIPLVELVQACCARGATVAFIQPYKRYRVSTQRFSRKPLNAEFVLLVDTARAAPCSAEAICDAILEEERQALLGHRELAGGPEQAV